MLFLVYVQQCPTLPQLMQPEHKVEHMTPEDVKYTVKKSIELGVIENSHNFQRVPFGDKSDGRNLDSYIRQCHLW